MREILKLFIYLNFNNVMHNSFTELRLVILILCLLTLSNSSLSAPPDQSAQDSVINEGRKLKLIKFNGKVRTIPHFKKIRVWTKDRKKPIKGKYTIVNDSTIAVDGQEIKLSAITRISGFTWLSPFSVPLIAGGSVGLGYGLVLGYIGAHFLYAYGPTAALFFVGSVGLAGLGAVAIATGAVIWHYSKTFRLDKNKWDVAVEGASPS